MLQALAELARPRDWLKNAFVFMSVPFAVASGATPAAAGFLLGLAGFCAVNSAVYAVNDVRDAERDREHPRKRLRPVASGRLSAPAALAAAAVWIVLGGGLLALAGHPAALLIAGIYVLVNAAYSLGAKHVPLLDVFLLAAGFVLRVLLGCALLDVPPSSWLLLCSSTLALMIALGKRRSEILHGLGASHRPSLDGYTMAFLDQTMAVMAGLTLIAYALYSLEAEVLLPGREFAGLPFVVFGVLDYLRLVHLRPDESGSPVELLLSSPAILLCGVGWFLATLWSVDLF